MFLKKFKEHALIEELSPMSLRPSQSMAKVYIFNPETDYALASNSPNFTPTHDVVNIRKMNSLLPALYAEKGSYILILDDIEDSEIDNLSYYNLAVEKELNILTLKRASRHRSILKDIKAEPWGWNLQLRRILTTKLDGIVGVPSIEYIGKLRELSHRRLTIKFLKEMKSSVSCISDEIELPKEISEVQDAISLFKTEKKLYFKAPWSSSGRGVLLSDDLEERHIRPWVHGIISRQGSVMVEKAYSRKLDFASEWLCSGGKCEFIGYSIFNVSRRGKYHSNEHGSQNALENKIKEATPGWNDSVIKSQQTCLEKLVAPYYNGPLGIDMLVTKEGILNPCVEINLRYTMGLVEIFKERALKNGLIESI